MAANDHNTTSPLDGLAELADAYEALQLLAMSEEGNSSPVSVVMSSLNKQFRAFLYVFDKQGLLS